MMMHKTFKLLVVCILATAISGISISRAMPNWLNINAKNPNYPEIFKQVIETIKRDYVEEVSEKVLYEAAIYGMLSSLDPHSTFFDAADYSDMQSNIKGEFAGLGVEITMRNGYIVVVSPYQGSPAFRLGLKVGDIITAIDGEVIQGISLQEAAARMRGPAGSLVKITIYRESSGESLDLEIIREVIKIVPVKVSLIDREILYINLSAFHQNTAKETAEAVAKVVHDVGLSKLKGAILDLRWNPGGLFDQSLAISELFLDKGKIVTIRGRHAESEQVYNAQGRDMLRGLPMVIIVNGGSASASEIVAGALQDNKRAVVIGTTTFGKGSVQEVIPVTKDTAIKLTTARYYTPKGTAIQAKGVIPDIIVNEAEVTPIASRLSSSEASLPGHLQGEDTTPPTLHRAPTVLESVRIKDYQLLRAIDLVKGMAIYQAPKA